MDAELRLVLMPGHFAVCRLSPDEPVPPWAWTGEVASVTRTADELSIVCREEAVPPRVPCEKGWRCMRVEGPLDFSLTGVFSSLAGPLAVSGISIFAVMTFDTDYLMVSSGRLGEALGVLRAAGHTVAEPAGGAE